MQPADADRWRRLQSLLDGALDLPAEQRASWLAAACPADPSVREEVERILAQDAATGGILDVSPDPLLQSALDEHKRDDTGGGRFIPGVVLAGRYRVVTLLGRGGMGEIYRADDLKLGQPVALKFLPSRLTDDERLLAALVREARIARQVSHPNVCRVYDIGEADRHTFITMEFIDGEDLRSLLKRIGQLPAAKALDIARQLCAGLQAAHELGVLHRDLKPANVMLDARGRVRITDFGIAVAAGDRAADRFAGTPAYMAPEQLDGRPASQRSDVYALGLVIYELFTGVRAFDAANVDDVRRLHESAAPAKPSALVAHLDPRIERALLACLETDPELRPASARALLAALPGGDPIEAAAEAGETPSPELIALSGPDGSLRPAVAFSVLAALVMAMGVSWRLADRASVLGWVQFPRGAEVLEDRARGILQRLGYASDPLDRVGFIIAGIDRYRRYVRAHDRSPRRWDPLREPGQWDVLFGYRESRGTLLPWNPDGQVRGDDPAPRPGDAQVLTDVRGHLVALLVHSDAADAPAPNPAAADWTPLFQEAGLDPSSFQPAAPTRNPEVFAETRAAWSGTGAGGYPIRVEAAAHRGRPVYFEQVVPWDAYWDPSNPLEGAAILNRQSTLMHRVLALLSLIAMPLAAAVLVARNWLNGRGDRAGALRVAALVFALRMTSWFLGAHHVPSVRDEWILFTIGLGKALVDAAAGWALYLAVEPYARRLHPRFLVSWTRLLRGRFRDPLVGRDLLCGISLSAATVLLTVQLPVVLPHALGAEAPPPPMFHPIGNLPYLFVLNAPPPQALLGGRHALAAVSSVGLITLGIALAFLVVLLALNILLRRLWPAIAVFAGLLIAINPIAEASGYSAVSVAASLASTLVFVLALRFGLVGVLAHWFGAMMWMNFPVTSRVDAPYFAIGLFGLAVVAAAGAYGAVIASRLSSSRRAA
ncbi:MAG TPA: serine/threonine-protein kinase [Vicinamibacterales bacterium]|nr:serine/threonine-protein kinase [Vicinamibacterales bacterium]